ncbi:DUF4230 domain-containing protein [Proteiniclasticum sp. C24MP]|uniref:DUF4230 domain-containing protein n=1 Tax=Proteiniclasticum sp. C24MP TaxID=3374101 RepID=UPI0037547C95
MLKKITTMILIVGLSSILYSCSNQQSLSEKPEEIEMKSITKLATLECYYHNVAKVKEKDASKFLFWSKDKNFWIEYSGIVKIGIDPSLLDIEVNEEYVTIQIPEAKVLEYKVDPDSLTDASYIVDADSAKITAEDESKAFDAAQENMVKTASNDRTLLASAQERAKRLIEEYIMKIGEKTEKEYSIEWIYIEDNNEDVDPADTEVETP